MTVDVDTIPAHAELVLEGHVLPGVRREEGPLAEFHGYYGEPWNSPVFEVTAVGYREAPIFQTIVPGWNEHIYIGNVLPREPLLMRFASHASKNVQAVHIPPYTNGFLVVVQLGKKANMGEPRNVALGAFAAHPNFRVCVVVESDVNIYDPSDLMWALTTRVDWGQDVFTVPHAQGHEMDPANDSKGIGTKIGIDATFDKGRRPVRCAGVISHGRIGEIPELSCPWRKLSACATPRSIPVRHARFSARSRQVGDELSLGGKLRDQSRALGAFEIRRGEARRHGIAEQGPCAAGDEPRTHPDPARHDELHALATGNIVAQRHALAAPVRVQQQHLDRVAEIEVPDLVRG